MKSLLFCLLLGSYSALAQSHKPAPPSASLVDKFFGFRDVGLETDIADHPEMKAIVGADSVESDPDKTYYFRPRENPQIGETKATLIQYFYYKDKAEGVLVVVTGAAERQKLLTALRAKYGAPTQAPAAAKAKSPQEEPYLWTGKKATLTLSKTGANGEASLLLLSNALWQREQADRKRKAGAGL
ncbi:hypothetical protein [Hymenobacter negativus]|uniref:Uncharacterized protein n=1 Tax=Hymenobacter negativus TaxID=2795026 RepID=A0ABS3QCR8_9BACT|nr:hypothetical protein [Hymenobacter negativus]MBO2008808.1 hypothetical protein [Hymenobacter negativus]